MRIIKGWLLAALLWNPFASIAQETARGFFSDEPRDAVAGFTRYHWPDFSRIIRIDEANLRAQLRHCPAEQFPMPAGFGQLIEIPGPAGDTRTFRIFQVPVMDPVLASKFPDFRTYAGNATDNSGATVRISLTELGFQAMIRDGANTVFIDPVTTFPNSGFYLVYYKNDLSAYRTFDCADAGKHNGSVLPQSNNPNVQRTTGTQLRTYRLALACTGEYAAFYGGTVSGAMSGIIASMNRVNGIYETDVAVRMTLIANNNLIIYTNASTDPYTNGSGSTMLTQNQTNLTNVIGSANYDIGHVFSTGGGGVAVLNSPCSSTNKAKGVTGQSSPVGDPFDVDYVAHEMGHQFGGLHTFNGTTSSCSGNRSSTAAYEPGSGITIMAYAGICGAENLAPHSIAYFHTYSYDQIANFTINGSGNTCAVVTNTGNTPPVISLGSPLTYTIPYLTPFQLTGSATDANGDALTYSWEQFDLGTASPPVSPNGPIFRSFDPVTSGTRVFPKLSDILSNTSTYGEWLPTAARNLRFRLTVRDNRANGGGVSNGTDTMKITVVNTGAAFSITSPNTAVTWLAGSSQTVTWNVSQTNIAPVSCANVKILLSTDGGLTFPHTVLASTPNDGSQTITVPAVGPITQARIKVEAVGNIFFDINNANFTIQSAANTVLNLRVFLQGFYNGGQTMDAVLGGANTDSVTVELHNATSPYTLVHTAKSVINTSGYGNFTYPGSVAGNSYYIVVRHRNSLETWSKFPVLFSANTSYSFTQ